MTKAEMEAEAEGLLRKGDRESRQKAFKILGDIEYRMFDPEFAGQGNQSIAAFDPEETYSAYRGSWGLASAP